MSSPANVLSAFFMNYHLQILRNGPILSFKPLTVKLVTTWEALKGTNCKSISSASMICLSREIGLRTNNDLLSVDLSATSLKGLFLSRRSVIVEALKFPVSTDVCMPRLKYKSVLLLRHRIKSDGVSLDNHPLTSLFAFKLKRTVELSSMGLTF